MAQLDDIQIDMAGCLIGVFAVLWLTKTGLPLEDPGQELIDLEIRIPATEKLHFMDKASEIVERWPAGASNPRDHGGVSQDHAKKRLLGALEGVWGGIGSSASTFETLLEIPIDPTDGSSLDDSIYRPAPSASPYAQWRWETRFQYQRVFRAMFNPADLASDRVELVVKNKNPSGAPLKQGESYLYRLLPRWEIFLGGTRVEWEDDWSRASLANLRLKNKAITWRVYKQKEIDCHRQTYNISRETANFQLVLQDDALGPRRCKVRLPD